MLKIKVSFVLMIAVFAYASSVTSASANFQAKTYPVKVDQIIHKDQIYFLGFISLFCRTKERTRTNLTAASGQLKMVPAFSECTVEDEGMKGTATVTTNECLFNFIQKTGSSEGSTTLECNNGAMVFKTSLLGCEFTVGSQGPLGKDVYTNNQGEIEDKTTLKEMTVGKVKGCVGLKEGEKGKYEGESSFVGEDPVKGEPISLMFT
jgi:hypothetical protein